MSIHIFSLHVASVIASYDTVRIDYRQDPPFE
jgi:hypothetical protein